MDKRTPRELESRTENARYEYVPPSALPSPNPEPGYGFRWIATHILGQQDPSNVSKRFREGWEPVKAADHPELQIAANKAGNIEVGGLVLCKAPQEMIDARTRYYAKQAQDQIRSVDSHYMRNEADKRMPLFTDKNSESETGPSKFGQGSK